MWWSHAVKYYWTVRRNEAVIHATTWMNPDNIMLSERSRHKGHILWDSTDTKYLK